MGTFTLLDLTMGTFTLLKPTIYPGSHDLVQQNVTFTSFLAHPGLHHTYCDADFSGLCNKALAPVDPSTSKSQSGWIIFYAGCYVSWASKLQSQVALYTTKAECIAMSQAMRDVIPIMGLLQETRERDFKVLCTKSYMYCKVFEDNSGALELARLPKLRPRSKHINVCYHYFCDYV